jgi:TIR domain
MRLRTRPLRTPCVAILEENRVRCWIAPRDVLPAEDYGEAIVRSMSASRLVVFVFSANANASPHVKRELEGAVSHGIPILPFRIEDAMPSDSLQYYLGGIHWLDALTPPLEAHLQHLAETVRILLDRNEQAPSGNRAPSAPSPEEEGALPADYNAFRCPTSVAGRSKRRTAPSQSLTRSGASSSG